MKKIAMENPKNDLKLSKKHNKMQINTDFICIFSKQFILLFFI